MCERAERVLDARIDLQTVVDHPRDDWQERYCQAIDQIAEYYQITSSELADAYFKHYGPSIMADVHKAASATDVAVKAAGGKP